MTDGAVGLYLETSVSCLEQDRDFRTVESGKLNPPLSRGRIKIIRDLKMEQHTKQKPQKYIKFFCAVFKPLAVAEVDHNFILLAFLTFSKTSTFLYKNRYQEVISNYLQYLLFLHQKLLFVAISDQIFSILYFDNKLRGKSLKFIWLYICQRKCIPSLHFSWAMCNFSSC
jgi:hypothetical protein